MLIAFTAIKLVEQRRGACAGVGKALIALGFAIVWGTGPVLLVEYNNSCCQLVCCTVWSNYDRRARLQELEHKLEHRAQQYRHLWRAADVLKSTGIKITEDAARRNWA